MVVLKRLLIQPCTYHKLERIFHCSLLLFLAYVLNFIWIWILLLLLLLLNGSNALATAFFAGLGLLTIQRYSVDSRLYVLACIANRQTDTPRWTDGHPAFDVCSVVHDTSAHEPEYVCACHRSRTSGIVHWVTNPVKDLSFSGPALCVDIHSLGSLRNEWLIAL